MPKFETGVPDPENLEVRVQRYHRMKAMRAQVPPMSYQKIADAVGGGMTRERVRQILAGPEPGVAGRTHRWDGHEPKSRKGKQDG